MNKKMMYSGIGALGLLAGGATGQVQVTMGQTNVLLDLDLLDSAAGLTLTGSSDIIAPGDLGANSVAFAINPRSGGSGLNTTFEYAPGLTSFSGAIEHTGTITFNDAVTVGDFTIGFDANRVGGSASGFFVESTTGTSAILFDVAAPRFVSATENGLIIDADLLVSAEFASFLGNSALTGADVGDALVATPTPGTVGVAAIAGMFAARRRRR